MTRKRNHREQLTVSLFPFLAVLICTLGVLIILLVITVKSAENQAAEQAAEQARIQQENLAAVESVETPEPDLPALPEVPTIDESDLAKQRETLSSLEEHLDIRQMQAEGIKEVRPDILARLATARAHREHLEENIRQTEREAQLLADELKRLMALETTADVGTITESDLETLRQKIADATERRDAKRLEIKQPAKKTYGIVPYRGQGGPFRRPIFVECTKDKLILQPHGIEIGLEEFVPPIETGNMLDSALSTVRSYFQKYKLGDGKEKPYPLLVIRPDGAKTYGLARRAMSGWDDEFGYELVESDVELEFGKPDQQLAAELRVAIDEARRRQQALAARRKMAFSGGRFASSGQGGDHVTGGQGDGESRPGFRVSSSQGGFVADGGDGLSSGRYAQQASYQGNNAEQGSFREQRENRHASYEKNGSEFQSAQNNTSGVQDNGQANNGQVNAAGGSGSASQGAAGPNSMAATRGANWALPSQTPGATGYVRPVRVVCQSDRFVISNAAGRQVEIPFESTSGNTTPEITDATVDQLVNETWKLIESWGIAGQNAFWKPQLRVTVMPGAAEHFNDIKSLLYQSGLGLEEVPQ